MSQQYYTLVTNIGAARIAKATALGTVVNLSQMAVGDGGGKPITPSATATALTREVYRASLNMLEVDENNQKQVIAELLIPEEEGDFTIREVGLFDNNNNLIAIGSIADSYKPRLSSGTASQQIIRMVIQIDNTDAVGLKVDPAVVLATREYVEKLINKKFKENGFGGAAQIVLSFDSRREFIAALENLTKLKDGAVIIAQGYLYKKQTGARYIPDAPDWLPINESFAHFDENYQSKGKSIVSTEYKNIDGLTCNTTYVKNIKPETMRKYFIGLDKQENTADLVTLKKVARDKKYQSILLNADAFFTPKGIASGKTKVQGLQVIDNEVIRDYGTNDNNDTLVMLRSGWLNVVKKSDNLSMDKIKNKGISWSAYFGPTLIKDGIIQEGLQRDVISSRNVIGQKPNRDIVIIQVQGETGKSGCTIQKAAELLLAEGCIFGYNLDGGGSTQMWWKDCYSFLSSDSNFSAERAVGGIIEIRADETGEFDTGWQAIQTIEGIRSADEELEIPAVCYRQVGAEVQLRISVSGNFKAGDKKVITTKEIPLRFTSVNFRDMRGMLVGGDLTYGMWYAGKFLSLRAIEESTYFTGTFTWAARNSLNYRQ